MKFHEYKNSKKKKPSSKVLEKMTGFIVLQGEKESPIKLRTRFRNADNQEAENTEVESSWEAKSSDSA